MTEQSITLGGGCFWCVEAAFLELGGVLSAESGYAGGHDPAPDYRSVCAGTTGHAEVVRIRFDADAIPLDEVLKVFFTVHDPTQLNRQGADVGTQYRSIVLFEAPEQEPVVRSVIEELEARDLWSGPFVTQVEPLTEFFSAEEYHRDYYRRNPNQGYCQVVISPKLAKMRASFGHRIRAGQTPSP